MATIVSGATTHTFHTLRGLLDVSAARVLVIARPGVDGHTALDTGSRPDAVEMESITDCDVPATTLAAYKALQGTLVTVNDDHGGTTTNVLVVNVVPGEAKRVIASSGKISTTGNYLLTCRWTLLPM